MEAKLSSAIQDNNLQSFRSTFSDKVSDFCKIQKCGCRQTMENTMVLITMSKTELIDFSPWDFRYFKKQGADNLPQVL